ncbi:hypothetical protein VSDG_00483 [Cytospora chrysosperma]|uniref:Uncharacterized protein n=1 Tax=Cytospora chrysosperma TaxID=252740 RepID=A0A423WQ90_CYTCH|nr:hypothetical protein VSDG_00483 [Valsa sordida]
MDSFSNNNSTFPSHTYASSGRRSHRSNTASSESSDSSFSLGNNFFSTYAPVKVRKGSASSASSYNSSGDRLVATGEISDPSQQSLLREIGAALTLSFDDDRSSLS